MEYDGIIGIDPGVNKSGFASYSLLRQRWEGCGEYTFEWIRVLLCAAKESSESYLVLIEDTTHSNTSQLYEARMQNFYRALNTLSNSCTQANKANVVAEVRRLVRISNNVGMNAATSKRFQDFAKRLNLPYEAVKPGGSYGKLLQDEFRVLTGIETKKSYQNERDARGLILDRIPVAQLQISLQPTCTDARKKSTEQTMLKGWMNQQAKKNKANRYKRRASHWKGW